MSFFGDLCRGSFRIPTTSAVHWRTDPGGATRERGAVSSPDDDASSAVASLNMSNGAEVEGGTSAIPTMTAAVTVVPGAVPPPPPPPQSRLGAEHPSVRFDRAALLPVAEDATSQRSRGSMLSESEDTGLSPMVPESKSGGLGIFKGKGGGRSGDKKGGGEGGGKQGSAARKAPGATQVYPAPGSTGKKKDGDLKSVDEFYGPHFDPEKPGKGEFYGHPNKQHSDRLFVISESIRSLNAKKRCSCGITKVVCILVVAVVAIVAIVVAAFVGPSPLVGAPVTEAEERSAHIQRPPETIGLLCSRESVETPWGYDACYEVCSRANCCQIPRDEPMSCLAKSSDMCDVYNTACTYLNDLTVPTPDDTMVDICSANTYTTDEGYAKCDEMCSLAKCCFQESQMGLCHLEHEEDCAIYRDACPFLADVTVLPPPDNFHSVCSPLNIASQEGFEECTAVCSRATCCNKPRRNNPGNCYDKNAETCDSYSGACEYLPYVVVPDPPADLGLICNPESLTEYEGYRRCFELCGPASCCSAHVGDANRCVDRDNNLDKCVVYETSCSFMRDIQVPPPPGDIVKECQTENVATMRGFNKCHDLCSLAPCCLLPEDDLGSCVTANKDACAVYQKLCFATKDVGSFGDYLSSLCTEENVQTIAGFERCKQGCDSAGCCFVPSWHAASCASYESNCQSYAKACYVLDDAPGSPSSQDEKALEGGVIQMNEDNQNESLMFSAVTVDLPQAPPALFEKCSLTSIGTPEGYEGCERDCEPAQCCFKDGDDSCQADNRYTCTQYFPCSVLQASSAFQPSPTLQSKRSSESNNAGMSAQGEMGESGNFRHKNDQYEEIAAAVAEACVNDFATESEFCKNFCKPFMCCFKHRTKGNCQQEMGVQCDAHAPCVVLVGIWDDSSETEEST